MKKIIISASTVGAAGVAIGALGLFGAGIASAAPDVVGMTYGDAVSEIEDGGGTAKIAVTVGDRQDAMGDCLVTNATDAPFVRDVDWAGEFGHCRLRGLADPELQPRGRDGHHAGRLVGQPGGPGVPGRRGGAGGSRAG